LSLGHGVFLGLGCYVTALLFNNLGVTPWIGAWAGVLVSMLVALVMGVMTLRMRGIFFALATVAVSLAFDELAKGYVGLTGGDNGLALKFLGNAAWAAQWRTPAPFVYAGLIFVVAYYAITRWILTSQFGLELRAVRDDEAAAAAAGVRVFRTKIVGFVVSAALTGLAGALYIQFYQSIDPETAFGLSQAIQLQLPALIGGLGTAAGPIIGGTVMTVLAELTNLGSTKLGLTGVDVLVYGLLLLVVILRAPEGIVGLLRKPARRAGGR
jgi:branched-chain amino acid transport system permease protein